jgi:Mg2+-importing ATPase
LNDYVDHAGVTCSRTYSLAYLNATSQSGKKNGIDTAIINYAAPLEKFEGLESPEKIAEMPFNFEKRRSSCIVRLSDGKLLLICKGAYEEVLALCARLRVGDKLVPLQGEYRAELDKKVASFNNQGFRVVLVATREVPSYELEEDDIMSEIEANLVAEGLLTFLDPPKDDAAAAIARLQTLGVDVRILTGDSLGVAMSICRTLNIVPSVQSDEVLAITGTDLAAISDPTDLSHVIRTCKIFAKLTPSQKGKVILALKTQGHVVGMLGDGINDCVALRYADAGVSVDTGASVAKDCADVILTEKSLSILVDCVTIGRITQGNTIKYIKMVASSNFGNVFSILIASCWLPFDPMTSLQILVQNLLYDISQIAIPWDRLDEEYIAVPQTWDIRDLLRFILILGPTSSTIDICTFCLNWFYYGIRDPANVLGVQQFHTRWFLEGLLTQTLIVHLLRTHKVPFFQSRAARPLVASTVTIIVVGFSLPYIPPIRNALQLAKPANSFIGFLALELAFYCVEVQLVKMLYVRLFKKWL